MNKEKWREKTEKIWKLLKLLNEYETPRSWVVYKSYDDYDWTFYWVDCDWKTEIAWSDSLICSKKFWWIGWLVENEKIDLDACEWEKTYNNLTASRDSNYSQYERLLMALSISEQPIELLCSILK